MGTARRVEGNRARYDRMAGTYARMVRSGGFDAFYRAVADAIRPRPGALLVDVGCGQGSLVPSLLPKLEPGGRILGADASGGMIARARERAHAEGWSSVRFERCDVHALDPGEPADIVVFCLSLSTMPDPEQCLARALGWLAPGGQLVVLDSFLQRGRPWANLTIRAKSRFVGADPSAISIDGVTQRLAVPSIVQLRAGAYTLVHGFKPEA